MVNIGEFCILLNKYADYSIVCGIDVFRAGTSVQYGTPRFLLASTVRVFCNGTGTVRCYGV